MPTYFPFHALGLQSNPFRALTDPEWADIVILPPALLDLAGQNTHLQILGPAGSGKTSALLGLAAHLRRAGQSPVYAYLPAGQATFTSPPPATPVFLLDEAQRLNHRERRRLLTLTARLIIAAHVDLAAAFTRVGQPLTTVSLGPLDSQTLQAQLEKRLAYFARPETTGPRFSFSPAAVAYLQTASAGDLRFIQFWLYEFFQRLPPPGPIQADALAACRPELPQKNGPG